MRLREILLTLPLVITLLSIGCTTEEEEVLIYTVTLRNATDDTLSIKGYNDSNIKLLDLELPVDESGGIVSYADEFFGGYKYKSIDSIVFKFNNNNKGYICIKGNSGFCFDDGKSIFVGGIGFEELDDNYYEFIITEEDYENAYDLP